MQSNDKVDVYVYSFVEIIGKLSELDIKINEELQVIMLLTGLPENYENFLVAIKTRDSLPSLEQLKIKLLEEGARREKRDDERDQSQAVYTHSKVNSYNSKTQSENRDANSNVNSKNKRKFVRKDKNKNSFEGNCYICKKYGHRAHDCRNKQKNEVAKDDETNNCLMHTDCGPSKQDKNTWCLDSGATSHMCCVKGMFISFKEETASVKVAAGKYVESPGIGTVSMKVNGINLKLQNVLNFLSVSKAAEFEHSISFGKNEAQVKNKQGQIMLRASIENNLYLFKVNSNQINAVNSVNKNEIKWHERYGHLNFKSLKKLNDLVVGIDSKITGRNINCDTCNKAKLCALPFPKKAETVTKCVLELIHTDVCGPMNVKSLAGNRYFITFIDDFTRKIHVYFLKAKNEAFEKFKIFKKPCTLPPI